MYYINSSFLFICFITERMVRTQCERLANILNHKLSKRQALAHSFLHFHYLFTDRMPVAQVIPMVSQTVKKTANFDFRCMLLQICRH